MRAPAGASAHPDARALASRDELRARLLACLLRGWDERYRARLVAPSPPAHSEQLRPVASWCVEYLDEHPGDPDELVRQLLDGFWSRPNLKRPKAEWLAEDPARYLEAAQESQRAAERAERRAQLEREGDERLRYERDAAPVPAEALGLLAIIRGDAQPVRERSPAELRRERERFLEEQRRAIESQRAAEVG